MFSTTARALFADDGRLLALVADGEEQPNPLAFLDVEEGADAPTREQIAEALAELDGDALQAVIDAAIAEGQSIAEDDAPITPELLARINTLADAREVAEERQGQIATEAQEAAAARDAALARLSPPAADDPADGSEGADGGEEGAETPAEGAPEPIAASGTRRRTTALPRPGALPSARPAHRPDVSEPTPLRANVALVAAAGLESVGLNTGQDITTAAQLGQAFNRRREALRGTAGGDGEKLTVASIRTEYPTERQLGLSLDENTARIEAAATREVLVASAARALANGAQVAAGGLCAPIEQLYDVPVLGSTARPVRDAMTNYGADRGGVKWRQHISFGDMAGATGVWTLANDEAVGTGSPPTPKPCIDVVCPDDAEAYVEAITLCLQFSNVTARFDPESAAANVQAAQIAHARFAENRLLAQIAALATTLTAPVIVSAVRDLLVNLDQLIAAYRNFYRLDDAIALRMVNPIWLRDMLRSDLTRGAGMGTDTDDLVQAFAVANATINAWFAARNVNITWHLDGRAATVAGAGEVTMAKQFYSALTDNGAVPVYPAQVESLLWVEGDLLHLDGGTLDLGVVRDSTLNQVNRYKQFSESFEGVAHRGVELVRLVSSLTPTGMTAGTEDTAAILAA